MFLNLSSGILPCATSECRRPRMLHRGDQWLHHPAAPPRRLQNNPEWGVQRGTEKSEHGLGCSCRCSKRGVFLHIYFLLRRSIPSKKSLEFQHLRWSCFKMWPKFLSMTSFMEKTVSFGTCPTCTPCRAQCELLGVPYLAQGYLDRKKVVFQKRISKVLCFCLVT